MCAHPRKVASLGIVDLSFLFCSDFAILHTLHVCETDDENLGGACVSFKPVRRCNSRTRTYTGAVQHSCFGQKAILRMKLAVVVYI